MGRPLKYNPSFMSDEEILANFSVRRGELDTLVGALRKNTGKSNKNILVVGVRGSGKTMLLHRLVVEIKNDSKLSTKWFPVVFSEENYEILSLDDLWLQTLYYISPPSYEALKARGGRDPNTEDMGLAAVLDFSDRVKKRILLVCENVGDLFDCMGADDVVKLRNILKNEPRIMIVGSSTVNFDNTVEPHPFGGFFKTISMKRLSGKECEELWRSVAGNEISPTQARALEILTGGSPRLLSILAWFGKDLSFVELMKELEMLIDDHTDYFKGQMEALPPKERKVFATLARLWTNSSSAEVAAEARMEQTETASLLSRLTKRGIVEEFPPEGGRKRGKTFQLSERLFNIYYLMRLGGRSSLWVKHVVEFLAQVFGANVTEELVNLDYAAMDGRALRCAALLMAAVDFGEQLDLEAHKHFANGDYLKTIEVAQKAFESQAKVLGAEHPATLKAWNHVASGYLLTGNFAKALEIATAANEAMTRLFGKNYIETHCSLGNICSCYAAMGEYDKALALFGDLFCDPDCVQDRLQYVNMLVVTMAAASPQVAEATLKALEESSSKDVLVALIAGIKAYLGMEFRAPQEIREIAEDIKDWIEKTAAKQASV